jgi:uroporphyrinogen decarboxylase
MSLFRSAIRRENPGRPPVWLMRQAGRYHSHYQELRKRHSFMDLCKRPELACETTLGPIRDFGFDAAILFSDLLFPLEALGMGLSYEPSPKLAWHLKSPADLPRLSAQASADHMSFQADALRLIRAALPAETGLLGFVGGPLTLFCYAVEGSHAGELASARAGLRDGRFAGFQERLLDLLAGNMALQARAGVDTVAVLDTCAGEFSPADVVPALRALLSRFHALCPDTPVTYYAKGAGPSLWDALRGLPIACLGIDWRQDLPQTLTYFGKDYAIQGNVDPEWMLLPAGELEGRLRAHFARVKELAPEHRRGWVCGLGHGVLQHTPEENVRLFTRVQREVFG